LQGKYDIQRKLDDSYSVRHALVDGEWRWDLAARRHADKLPAVLTVFFFRRPKAKNVLEHPHPAAHSNKASHKQAAAKHAAHRAIVKEPAHSTLPPPGTSAAAGALGMVPEMAVHGKLPFHSIIGGHRPDSVADQFKEYKTVIKSTVSDVEGGGKASKPAQ